MKTRYSQKFIYKELTKLKLFLAMFLVASISAFTYTIANPAYAASVPTVSSNRLYETGYGWIQVTDYAGTTNKYRLTGTWATAPSSTGASTTTAVWDSYTDNSKNVKISIAKETGSGTNVTVADKSATSYATSKVRGDGTTNETHYIYLKNIPVSITVAAGQKLTSRAHSSSYDEVPHYVCYTASGTGGDKTLANYAQGGATKNCYFSMNIAAIRLKTNNLEVYANGSQSFNMTYAQTKITVNYNGNGATYDTQAGAAVTNQSLGSSTLNYFTTYSDGVADTNPSGNGTYGLQKTGYHGNNKWHIDSATGTLIDATVSHTGQSFAAAVGKSIAGADNSVTLYADYEPNDYTITFNPRYGTFQNTTSTSTKTVTYDSLLNNMPGIPTRTGHTFDGWYTSSSGGTQVFDEYGRAVNSSSYWDGNGNGPAYTALGNSLLVQHSTYDEVISMVYHDNYVYALASYDYDSGDNTLTRRDLFRYSGGTWTKLTSTGDTLKDGILTVYNNTLYGRASSWIFSISISGTTATISNELSSSLPSYSYAQEHTGTSVWKGTSNLTLYAHWTVNNPATPTITGATNKIFGEANPTLTCATTTSYTEVVKYYSFGYATSDGGTPSNWTEPTSTATKTINTSSYIGQRWYSCRVYVSSSGGGTSSTITSSTTADIEVTVNNVTATFNANSGTISGTSPQYLRQGTNLSFTGIRNDTQGAIPTATRDGYTFGGWYDSLPSGTQVFTNTGAPTSNNSYWSNTAHPSTSTADLPYTTMSCGGVYDNCTGTEEYGLGYYNGSYYYAELYTREWGDGNSEFYYSLDRYTGSGWKSVMSSTDSFPDTSLYYYPAFNDAWAHRTASDHGASYWSGNNQVYLGTSNVTLYAHWTKAASSLAITLSPTSYVYDGNSHCPTPTVKDGSTTLTNNTEYTYSCSSNTNIGTASITITNTNAYNNTTNSYYSGSTTVNFYINNATLTFNANGGSGGGTVYTKTGSTGVYTGIRNTTVGSIPTVTPPSQKQLEGWYTASSGGTKVLNADGSFTGTAVSGYTTTSAWATTTNQTLYAQYENTDYTLTFNANGGTVSPTSMTKTYGQTLTDLPTPTRTGYSFKGWYANINGTGSNVINMGREYNYTDVISIHASAYMPDWSTLNNTSSSIAILSSTESGGYEIVFEGGTAKTLSYYLMVGTSYVIISTGQNWGVNNISPGWHDFDLVYNGSTVTAYYDGSVVGTSSKTDTINYHSTANLYVGAEANATSYDSGSVFPGYVGNVIVKNTSTLTPSTTYNSWTMTGQNATLYAKWTPNIYTISLDNQSATTAGSTAIYEKYATGYYLESSCTNQMTTSANGITIPTKTGYAFGGYYTSATGGTQYINSSGKLTSSASNTNFTANGTLYAHWLRTKLTITETVKGNQADALKEFTFTINVKNSGTGISGTYAYTGSKSGNLTFSSGNATFTLHHNQYIDIYFPTGYTYTITQDNGSYTLTKTNDSGTFSGTDITSTFTDTLSSTTPTGLLFDIFPYILLLLSSVGSMVVVNRFRDI
ncbi:MAG: InlB B-repeat-containing protein [Bacilli bacterium]|nr:InlB B-repeat-containing protein [Bacilli bacterium]